MIRGITVRRSTEQTLPQIELRLPPLPTQRKIAAILSAYDDLIEVNTRRIALLEEMARGLYREWFVRFRFPGHEGVRMVESAVGLVPEGWEVGGWVMRRHRDGKQPQSSQAGNEWVMDTFIGSHRFGHESPHIPPKPGCDGLEPQTAISASRLIGINDQSGTVPIDLSSVYLQNRLELPPLVFRTLPAREQRSTRSMTSGHC